VGLLLIVCVITVKGYGPYSHYVFACQGLLNVKNYPINQQYLYFGADLPDAMWNGWFMTGTGCPTPANQLHNPIYAGYIILEALNNPDYSTDPKFYSLGVGYATHNIADAVGFYPFGGYLGNGSSIIAWSTKWIHMLALDAFIVQEQTTYPFNSQCTPYEMDVPKESLDFRGVAFLAAALETYHENFPNSPSLNETQLASCTNPWGPAVNVMNQYAQKQYADSTIRDLLFFDVFNAVSVTEIQKELLASFTCIMNAIEFYMKYIIQPGVTPLESWAYTFDYISSQFARGICNAPTSH